MCARGGPQKDLKKQKGWVTVTCILNGRFINEVGVAVCYSLLLPYGFIFNFIVKYY